MLTAVTGSALIDLSATAAESPTNHFLEVRQWRLHNTVEDQSKRVAEYLEKGFAPALERSGVRMAVQDQVRFVLLGGKEIGTDTLLRWYVLHVLFVPFVTVIFLAIHFWRVRKDGGISGPL